MIAATVAVRLPADLFSASCALGPIGGDVFFNSPNIGVVPAYERLYRAHRASQDVIVYMHDDVEVFEYGWADRVAAEFENPKVAIVGFGGALGMGLPDIYKVPYATEQLQRIGYYSNQRDWEIHGKREAGSRRVAVVDGFVMAVRVAFLHEIGGWEHIKTQFHCYDTGLCLMAHRNGWQVRMVGVDCLHYGGGTSTKPEYISMLRDQGRTAEDDHRFPHLWQYDEFRDVLPLRIA